MCPEKTKPGAAIDPKRNQYFRRSQIIPGILLLFICFYATACKNTSRTNLIQDQAIANEQETSDWLAYGRTHSEQRFSPLENVNTPKRC